MTASSPSTKVSIGTEGASIGRAAECTIPLKDRYLSRKHAEICANDGFWSVRDCGSANGTYLNGNRLDREMPMHSGDRIRLGDTELIFKSDQSTDRLEVGDAKITATISIPVEEILNRHNLSTENVERLQILNALAVGLIDDHPLDSLFGVVLDQIMEHLRPSRAAIALVAEGSRTFSNAEVRRADVNDSKELSISRTLLDEVVLQKRALAYMDVSMDEKLSHANSIILQGIHSVLCAPILINDTVEGVLYVDFLFNQTKLDEEDLKLVAQIARFAAVKLENTRLRENALQKALTDEELKMAYTIQRRLLPETPPPVAGFSLFGINRPFRTVSGDYYDFARRPDGSLYFVIADVSGKGVTAALLMAGLQASFRIFTKADPSPSELVTQLNGFLKENLPQSKFVTLLAGRLNPATGEIVYTNAGHTPPVWVRRDENIDLTETDLLLGVFANATFRDQMIQLDQGDALVLFTDGITEAEDAGGEEFSQNILASALRDAAGHNAAEIGNRIEQAVISHRGAELQSDDITLLVIARD